MQQQVSKVDATSKSGHAPQNVSIQFTGKTMEYFGIFFTNKVLTWITLGIYSAWAKVKNLRYFYGHTELLGGHFQFTASPIRVLVGRIIAGVLFCLWIFSDYFSSTVATAIVVLFVTAYAVLGPIIIVWTMSFRLRYSAWRGIDFHFRKNYKGAYFVYFVPNLLLFSAIGFFIWSGSLVIEEIQSLAISNVYEQQNSLITEESESDAEPDHQASQEQQYFIYYEMLKNNEQWYLEDSVILLAAGIFLLLVFILSMPFFAFMNARYLVSHTQLGQTRFRYRSALSNFYSAYGMWTLMNIGLIGFILLLFVDIFSKSALLFFIILSFTLSLAFIKCAQHNLLYSGIVFLKGNRVRSSLPFLGYWWVMISNWLATILTIGLLRPWAKIRMYRYQLHFIKLKIRGGMDSILSDLTPDNSALAEEISDVFDLDLGVLGG